MINTTVLVPISTFFTLLLSSMSGYVFTRNELPGIKFLLMAVLSLMMIPGVLTLTPSYKLMQDLKLYNTWWASLFPCVSGGQVLGILLCRTFISGHPAAFLKLPESTELLNSSPTTLLLSCFPNKF